MSDAKHIGELAVGETAVLQDMNLPKPDFAREQLVFMYFQQI